MLNNHKTEVREERIRLILCETKNGRADGERTHEQRK